MVESVAGLLPHRGPDPPGVEKTEDPVDDPVLTDRLPHPGGEEEQEGEDGQDQRTYLVVDALEH